MDSNTIETLASVAGQNEPVSMMLAELTTELAAFASSSADLQKAGSTTARHLMACGITEADFDSGPNATALRKVLGEAIVLATPDKPWSAKDCDKARAKHAPGSSGWLEADAMDRLRELKQSPRAIVALTDKVVSALFETSAPCVIAWRKEALQRVRFTKRNLRVAFQKEVAKAEAEAEAEAKAEAEAELQARLAEAMASGDKAAIEAISADIERAEAEAEAEAEAATIERADKAAKSAARSFYKALDAIALHDVRLTAEPCTSMEVLIRDSKGEYVPCRTRIAAARRLLTELSNLMGWELSK